MESAALLATQHLTHSSVDVLARNRGASDCVAPLKLDVTDTWSEATANWITTSMSTDANKTSFHCLFLFVFY